MRASRVTDARPSASVPAHDTGTDGHAEAHEGAWLRDLLCGSVFVALGLAFAIGGSRYEIGSAVRMGPGYLPLVLGGALALLGFVTLVQGVISWRSHAAPSSEASGAPEREGYAGASPGAPNVNSAAGATGAASEAETETEPQPAHVIPWARGALILGAIIFFGLTIEGLGVIPTVFVTALLAALAGQHTKLVRVVLTAVGITLVTWLIFVVLLQLRLPLFGDWLGG